MPGLFRDRCGGIWVSLEFPRKRLTKKAMCAEGLLEDTQNRSAQVKTIKPPPGVELSPETRKGIFPSSKRLC